MNPRELAERLRNLPPHELAQMLREQAEALPRLQEGDRPSFVVMAVMRQAADLLATARVEWRITNRPRLSGDTAASLLRRNARVYKTCPGWYNGTGTLESHHVIDTPWVEEGSGES